MKRGINSDLSKVIPVSTQQDSNSGRKLVDRVGQLGKLHDVDQSQVSGFIQAAGLNEINGRAEIQIADLFCGNGFTTGVLINELVASGMRATIHLLDMSGELLQVAARSITEQLPPSHRDRFTVITYEQEIDGIRLPFANEQLDLVIVKMGLHELPFKSQVYLIQQIYYTLKPEGRLIIWGNLIRKDQSQRDLSGFNSIIRKKDLLAGFDAMSSKRYFTSQEEIFSALIQAGFTAQLVMDWIRKWNSLSRLDPELDGDIGKLNELNAEIDRHFSDEKIREQFGYCRILNHGEIEGRSFSVRSGIILAKKPAA